MYERVLLKKTLLCGGNVYKEGEYVHPDIPKDILQEVAMGTGVVEILKESPDPVPTIIDSPSLEAMKKSTTSSVVKSKNIVNKEVTQPKKKTPVSKSKLATPKKTSKPKLVKRRARG